MTMQICQKWHNYETEKNGKVRIILLVLHNACLRQQLINDYYFFLQGKGI